jgi:hypothetical protein
MLENILIRISLGGRIFQIDLERFLRMISFPDNTKQIIDNIRGAIGRNINIGTTILGSECPACTIDPLTNMSSDPFCSTCSGYGYLTSISGTTVSAHVNWNVLGSKEYHSGGFIEVGDCIATIEFSEELLSVIENADYFEIDDEKVFLKEYDLRGVPDINRIRMYLQQDPVDD